MKPYRFLRMADNDYAGAVRQLTADAGVRAATRFVRRFEKFLETVRTHPQIYAAEGPEGTRMCQIGRFDYLFVYLDTDTEIVIVAVPPARADYGRWAGRVAHI